MPTKSINDISIYYEIQGEGETLCLIAGLGMDITDWKSFVHLFSQKYRVIVFDNRGVGRTDMPDTSYSIPMMAEDTAGLLKALAVEAAHILGVSMGGRIAMELTLQHPEMVKSLILVSTSSRYESNQSRRLFNIMLKIPWWRNIGKKYPQPNYAVLLQRDAVRDYDATGRLHEISVPTLILHGNNDNLVPFRLAKEMHLSIKDSMLKTFNGGHHFLFVRPQPFLDAVIGFLESW